MSRQLTNSKIIFAVGTAITTSFLVFFCSLYYFHNQTQSSRPDIISLEKKFYHQNLGTEKKIFILGSSNVRALNTTYINNYLAENDQNYTIYNLYVNGEVPLDRLETINMIISAKPDMIVYGIADRDFINSSPQDESGTAEIIGQNPHAIFNNLAHSIINYSQFNFDFLQSPELDMLASIHKLGENLGLFQKEHPLNTTLYPNTPFAELSTNDFQISNVTDNLFLESHFSYTMDPYEKNENCIALGKIIDQLRSHGIHVIIFVAPVEKYYLDNMPSSYAKTFDQILDKLSEKHHIKVYSLLNKYSDFPIWHDTQHIAIQKLGIELYSHDIAQIILHEIGQ